MGLFNLLSGPILLRSQRKLERVDLGGEICATTFETRGVFQRLAEFGLQLAFTLVNSLLPSSKLVRQHLEGGRLLSNLITAQFAFCVATARLSSDLQ